MKKLTFYSWAYSYIFAFIMLLSISGVVMICTLLFFCAMWLWGLSHFMCLFLIALFLFCATLLAREHIFDDDEE